MYLRWGESGCSDEIELGVADEFSSEPEEGFLEVVVGLGGDVIVLEVFLPVECDRLCLDFAFLHIDLITAEDDRDVFADTDEVTCTRLVIAARKVGLWENIRCQLGTFL